HIIKRELYRLEPAKVQSTITEPLKLDWISSEFSKLQSIKEHFPKEQKSTSEPDRSQEKKLELSKKHNWKEAPVNNEC
ncbi:MAG TPA: hypothetical protein PKW39_03075, partial [Rectinema sp.]|nr:hypothetical protein [Rectinema sp.]